MRLRWKEANLLIRNKFHLIRWSERGKRHGKKYEKGAKKKKREKRAGSRSERRKEEEEKRRKNEEPEKNRIKTKINGKEFLRYFLKLI